MTIDELKAKHFIIPDESYKASHRHIKLSIQFAIEVLEELNQTWVGDSKMIYVDAVQNKVQELKEYLNEEV